MSGTNQPTRSRDTQRTTDKEREMQELEHACNLPEAEKTPPDAERGERVGTSKAIATGGKGDDACDTPGEGDREERPKSP